MRDPKRIPKVLKDLQTIWEYYPDWRLGQLVCNIGKWKGHFDPFLEDGIVHDYLGAMLTTNDEVTNDIPEDTLKEMIEEIKLLNGTPLK